MKNIFIKKSIYVLLSCTAFSGFAAEGDPYTWPSYRSDLDYDTKENIGEIKLPTKFSTDCDGVTGQKAGKWWAFYWGKDRDSRVTDETIDSLLKKYDTDFSYLIDSMGWAPDRRAQNGYYSAVYYYGSGTCAGGAKTDTLGGWQTMVGSSWYEAVAASFYPVYSFNPSCTYHDKVAQQNAMVHEGIHSMTKAYPGAQNAHWFQEGGNTWIQQEMESRRSGVYSGMGFLNAAALIAPFIPIESYSGWLLDGSFGGPGAEGVDARDANGKQLCTWRNLLGGYQYGNLFPTFLGEWVGKGAVRWLYGNATRYLLEAFGTSQGLGEDATRRLIMEYRARLALLDLKKWSDELKNLLNSNFLSAAKEEWTPASQSVESWTMTPYTVTTDSSGTLIPEYRTTPGWSGANIIPLKVKSGASVVSATLKPLGENMSLQICYRATDGTPVYSTPVLGAGKATLRLDKTPQDSIVFAVICNTDFNYTDNIRMNHYDYRLKLESGISGAGSATTAYYRNFVTTYDWDAKPETPASSSSSVNSSGSVSSSSMALSSSSVSSGSMSSAFVSSSSAENISSSSSNTEVENIQLYEYASEITLPIDENYAGVTVDLDIKKVAEVFGIAESEIATKVTYFALDVLGMENETSTANAPGHWFSASGNPIAYGEDAYIYSEFNLTTMTALIGHYPNKVANGESYTIKQGLKYNDKKMVWTFTIKISNDKPETEQTPNAFAYQKQKPNLSLNYSKGSIFVKYTLAKPDYVKIALYTASGAFVHAYFTGKQNAGTYEKEISLSSLSLSSGTYIVKISGGRFHAISSITAIR